MITTSTKRNLDADSLNSAVNAFFYLEDHHTQYSGVANLYLVVSKTCILLICRNTTDSGMIFDLLNHTYRNVRASEISSNLIRHPKSKFYKLGHNEVPVYTINKFDIVNKAKDIFSTVFADYLSPSDLANFRKHFK